MQVASCFALWVPVLCSGGFPLPGIESRKWYREQRYREQKVAVIASPLP